MSGMRLIIAGIIQDKAYFREQVEPHSTIKISFTSVQ